MPCDTKLKRNQTIQQRNTEVKEIAAFTDELIRKNRLKVLVDKRTGAIAFDGMTDSEKDGCTDACTYRLIMATGTALAKTAIARAETGRGTRGQQASSGQWRALARRRSYLPSRSLKGPRTMKTLIIIALLFAATQGATAHPNHSCHSHTTPRATASDH